MQAMTTIVILGGARTAIGTFGGSLAGIAPIDLGATAAKAALVNLGVFYADTLPASGTDGQICLVPVG